MNKTRKFFFVLILLSLVISSCSSIVFYDDRIVGTWQDLESNAEFGLRFASNEEFYTLFLGQYRLEGSYEASGGILNLHYYDCEANSNCDVRLGYTITDNTLVITDATGDIRLRRIE